MAAAIVNQLQTTKNDEARTGLLVNLHKSLFSAPGLPLQANFFDVDFPLICSLQSDETPLVSIWLLQTLSEICRKNDICT